MTEGSNQTKETKTKESTAQTTNDNLDHAVKLVKAAIEAERAKYIEMAKADNQDSAIIEGTTSRHFGCTVMVLQQDVARIYLEYDYPVWEILEEDAPTQMWDELAMYAGLETACSVDL